MICSGANARRYYLREETKVPRQVRKRQGAVRGDPRGVNAALTT